LYDLIFRSLGSLAVAAHLGKLFALVLLDGLPACFRLFLVCELYHVIYGYVTIKGLANVDIILIKIMHCL